jgi:hypothetical protein
MGTTVCPQYAFSVRCHIRRPIGYRRFTADFFEFYALRARASALAMTASRASPTTVICSIPKLFAAHPAASMQCIHAVLNAIPRRPHK